MEESSQLSSSTASPAVCAVLDDVFGASLLSHMYCKPAAAFCFDEPIRHDHA